MQGVGVGVWIGDLDYRALIKHETDWQTWAEKARRCEVKP